MFELAVALPDTNQAPSVPLNQFQRFSNLGHGWRPYVLSTRVLRSWVKTEFVQIRLDPHVGHIFTHQRLEDAPVSLRQVQSVSYRRPQPWFLSTPWRRPVLPNNPHPPWRLVAHLLAAPHFGSPVPQSDPLPVGEGGAQRRVRAPLILQLCALTLALSQWERD